ncbi:MAG: AbrB/MazE/SpoVT family DNA-binding domain-containing protein [Sphingobacteriaceae bacterium]|nr:MAG: AbrB/MazE/SpoVT family DNA-binding domain-containing protein [Sphingobacteriaceae bacterium]
MKSSIRNIGNSKGIILPQNILKECEIEYEVNLEVKDKKIIITPVETQKRKGWAEAFQEMAKNGDDELIIPDVFEEEDFSDWTWK